MSTPEGFELWSKYEDVAMHFNGLLIQFRVGMLGGLTALTTIGGYLVGEKVTEHRSRWGVLAFYSFLFGAAWAAAAALDLVYYRELLRGSVRAITALEAKSTDIKLSTTIEAGMNENRGPYAFYGLPLLALFVVFLWALHKYRTSPQLPAPHHTEDPRAGSP